MVALAGLQRLGRAGEGAPLAELLPPGQGCLALEARAGDAELAATAALTDADALRALTAERALVETLGATCHTPVGAHARSADDELVLSAFVGLPDGSHWIRDELAGPADDPAAVGRRSPPGWKSAGARALLAEAERAAVHG